jgi:uncharacterized repeat protein (TIGR01451 family)
MAKKAYIPLIILLLLGVATQNGGAAPPAPDKRVRAMTQDATPCPTGDAYEDSSGGERDDTVENASHLTAPDGQPGHTFDWETDTDWAYFYAQGGVEYTIATSNLSPEYDPGGFFTDTVLELYEPDGVTLVDMNDDFGGSYRSQLEWLAPQTGVFYLKVYNYNPEVYGCEVSYDLTLTEAGPLEITKSAQDLNGSPLYVGDILEYEITVHNPNPDERTGVVITDTLPSGTTYLQGSATISANTGDWLLVSTEPVLEVTGSSLPAGESVSVLFQVQVDPGTVGQTIANQAHVDSDQSLGVSTPWITPPGGGMVTGPMIFYFPIIAHNH